MTFDDARPEIPDGVLYIDDTGIIQGVAARGEPAPAGFDHATRVDTGGLVYPGLIDLHNHMAYNCLSLWLAPDHPGAWTTRNQWPNDKDYKPSISLPANALCHADGKAVLKYVETKAAVGGVTAIQGSAKLSHPFEGFMVRNVEFETFGGKKKSVNQSVRAFESADQYDAASRDLAAGHAFLYHLAEGTDPALISDYDGLRDHHCLQPKFIGIHSTALGSDQFTEWHATAKGGAIVWSPFSNLWLYGKTTDVVAAGAAGLVVCLGADWSPSGSKSVLGELKVADLHNKLTLGGALSVRDICAMVTCNPARALGWEDLVGQLKVGLHGDFAVMTAKGHKDPYRTLIDSVEADVLLVAINGYPIYGTADLMTAAAAVNPDPIQITATLQRRITLRDDRIPDADLSWTDVVARLEAARRDPAGARTQALALDQVAEPPVELVPDKAWDDPTAHPELLAESAAATIPPLDPLTPDEAFFAALSKRAAEMGNASGLHALDTLHTYYGL